MAFVPTDVIIVDEFFRVAAIDIVIGDVYTRFRNRCGIFGI